ncbi:hypothetical protein GCM10027051_12950 [Niabella terrae]
MFNLLSNYLLEHKSLALPRIGVFEIRPRNARADMSTATIEAPDWNLHFRADNNPVEALQNGPLYDWLSTRMQLTREAGRERFEQFVQDLERRLMNGEQVLWPELGQLEYNEGAVLFTPQQEELSPFSPVTAQKVLRENSSHASLVGDRETTTGAMRQELSQQEEPRPQSRLLMWILLGLALAAGAWYFSVNGCSKTASGNRQQLDTKEPSSTYQLR